MKEMNLVKKKGKERKGKCRGQKAKLKRTPEASVNVNSSILVDPSN
jgi:hypothetical protein